MADGNCTIKENGLIQNGEGKNGGAVYILKGSFFMEGGAIRNAEAESHGGAVYVANGAFTMSDGVIEDNAAGGNGGGVYVSGGSATVSGGVVQHNTASGNGGGAYLNGGNLTVTGGSFSGNRASGNGGGAYISGGNFELNGESASITENSAANGAGIYLTGGTPELLKGSLTGNTASANGGGIYIDGREVNLTSQGVVSITENKAANGAGIYISGTAEKQAGFTVHADSQGTVNLSGNTATDQGGAVCISNGYCKLESDKVSMTGNQADKGGAAAVLSGDFAMTNGTIDGNNAKNGGAVYVSGGDATIGGGSITGNTASENGGGVAVEGGKVIMYGGEVSGNRATNGQGGGMYIASTGEDVSAMIYSGTLFGNSAKTSGGAVGIQGTAGSKITVQIGVNENHFNGTDPREDLPHIGENMGSQYQCTCPVIENNKAQISGGAFFVAGNSETVLNIYCLVESGNNAEGDLNIQKKCMSTFMMVESGNVTLSTAKNNTTEGESQYGNITITGNIHVDGGSLNLYGSKENPRLEGALFVDMASSADVLNDKRVSGNRLTIQYHENFYDADSTPNSLLTEFDVDAFAADKNLENYTHKINPALYAHEGYKIYGWNTEKGAIADQTQDGWYDMDDVYTFHVSNDTYKDNRDDNFNYYGNLTLYAIWKANGYTVKFIPGAEAGETVQGEVEPVVCEYNSNAKTYPVNEFIRPGYQFTGWLQPDGKVKQPHDIIWNLTDISGATVTVVAQWKKCEHPNVGITKSGSEQEIVATKTCTDCGMTAKATLTAQDTVYDGMPHKASLKLECTDASFWQLELQYVAEPLKAQDGSSWEPKAIPADKMHINAAKYTATLYEVKDTEGEEPKSEPKAIASVTYTIQKAEKPVPGSRPSYDVPTDDSNVLKIYQIPVEQRTWTSDKDENETANVEYIVQHFDSNENKDVNEIVGMENLLTDPLEHTLPSGIQVYSVHVRYQESDNYNASAMVSANYPFLFEQGFVVYIKADVGIKVEQVTGDTGKALKLSLEEGYYLVSTNPNSGLPDFCVNPRELSPEDPEFGNYTKSDGSFDNDKYVMAKDYIICTYADGTVTLSTRSDKPTEEKITYVAVLEIGDAALAAEVSGKIIAKEHFGDFTGSDETTIGNDSAFTAYYEVKNFDADAYQAPQLTFSQSLPVNTSIILRDRTNGSYWYTVLNGEAASVELSSFKSMQATGTTYQAVSGDLRLQFIVDFSDAQSAVDTESLTVTLSLAAAAGKENIVKGVSKPLTVNTHDVSIGMSAEKVNDLTQKLTVDVTGSVADASKYDHRDLALVLTPVPPEGKDKPENLPLDAYMNVSQSGSTTRCYPQQNGTFIIPLGNVGAENGQLELNMELVSDMFPTEEMDYAFEAALYLSSTDAEIAPLAGTNICQDNLMFTGERVETGISIQVTKKNQSSSNEPRIFTSSDTVCVGVDVQPEGLDSTTHKVVVELHQELDGIYGNTMAKPSVDDNTYQFGLGSYTAGGDFCIVAQVRKNDLVVSEARYYFIIENPNSER